MMHGKLASVSLLVALIAVAAQAQVRDPTRPADAVMVQEAGGGVVAAESGLQTVILRPRGKSAAVINGQYVEVGGVLGDRRVLKISESEVILQGPSGREVMRVTPDIQKVPSKQTNNAIRRTTGTAQK